MNLLKSKNNNGIEKYIECTLEDNTLKWRKFDAMIKYLEIYIRAKKKKLKN